MEKLKKILHSTMTKVISTVLVISFVLSGFFFFDFYLIQYNKIKGYWWVFQGDKALKKQDLQKAINCYERGVKLHPGHYKAMYNLANIYVVYEDYYSALKNYKKALLVKPEYEIARIDYAIILTKTYEIDSAIDEYKKVIEKRPRFLKIPFLIDTKKSYTYNKGVAYYNMGLAYRTKSLTAGLNRQISKQYLKKASESYEQAVLILDNYSTNYNLGLVNQLLKNHNQAGYYYCRAIELSPMDYEAHFNLAVLLNDMKDYKNSQLEFQKAGLLLDSKGEGSKTRYIYNVLDEVNKKIAINTDPDYYKKQAEKEELEDKSVYKSGKLVIVEPKNKKDDDLKKSFRTCDNKEYFIGGK